MITIKREKTERVSLCWACARTSARPRAHQPQAFQHRGRKDATAHPARSGGTGSMEQPRAPPAEAASPPPAPQPPAEHELTADAADPFCVLPPELVQRFVGLVPPNEAACVLRLVSKAAAKQLCRPQDRTVRLSLPVPHPAFVRRWGGADAFRSLNRAQRRQLTRLTARSGSIPNLEVLLARSDAVYVTEEGVLTAAVASGQLDACRWLRQQGCRFSWDVLTHAAKGGHQPVCEWLFAVGNPLIVEGAAGDAARGGHVGLVDWLLGPAGLSCRDSFCSPDIPDLLAGVAAGCDLPTLKRLHHAYLSSVGRALPDHPTKSVTAYAAGSPTADWAAKVEWLEERGYRRTAGACKRAAKLPDGLARLQWLRQRGYGLTPEVAVAAAKGGNVDVLRLVLAEGVKVGKEAAEEAIQRAACAGHAAFLRALLHGRACKPENLRGAALAAANAGHLSVLEFLVEVLDAADVLSEGVLKAAVRSGSMELLAWLHGRGCPLDASMFAVAAECGSEEQLEWLVARGCPMGEEGEPYYRAAIFANTAVLGGLRRLGCPWGPRTFVRAVTSYAAGCGYSREALRWLLEVGCPVPCWQEVLRAARPQDRPELAAWLAEQMQLRGPQLGLGWLLELGCLVNWDEDMRKTEHKLPGEATPPFTPQQQQVADALPTADAADPSRIWLPELVQRFAGCLTCNEVACVLRLVNKAAAAQFSRPQERTIRLSLPVPHPEFARRWGGMDAFRSLNRAQRHQLPCLTARSGSIANLEVLLARGDTGHVLEGPALDAAAAGGQLEVCRWLRQQGCPYSTCGSTLCIASRGGQQAVCEWLLADVCPQNPWAAVQAACGGHVGLMDWLLAAWADRSADNAELLQQWLFCLLAGAARGCDLPTLQRLHHAYLDSVGEVLSDEERMAYVVSSAAASPAADWRAKVEWLEGRGYCRTAAACEQAAKQPDGLARLQWLRQRGYPLDSTLIEHAGHAGNTDLLDFLLEEGVEMDQDRRRWAANAAACMGHVSFLRALLYEHGCQAADLRGPTAAAARAGRLPVLEFLVEALGAADVLTVGVFKTATQSGSVELLGWLHAHGCPWDQSVFSAAAELGSEEVVEWLAKRGCPMGERGTPYLRALCNGDLSMLRCLRRLGCPWGPRGRVFTRAVGGFGAHCVELEPHAGPIPASTVAAQRTALRWLLEQGCPVVWGEALRMVQMQERYDLLAWFVEQRRQRRSHA
ncbi:Ankyrin repeat domain-containing protein [Tetrabaena socialis]|uniref:Ankyrin repeat domain-containing protein n=1 Tax=Tetrabaena socialis TaxID=47790 RepID=A0A2J8A0E5_9CHLO|nr:Ankyrin repeat domain-containing protein [Tetrabaena socialis]|eukprot:PNH05989.1 Ankyrin repeat domain-containing protein [Tetrabaena socialis]